MKSSVRCDNQSPKFELPLHLSTDVVHVVRVGLDLTAEQWNSLREFLTTEELERADRFRFDEPRRRFIVCRATLRRILASCCGVTPREIILGYANHGKPGLSFDKMSPNTPRIEFNVSHSGELGLIAVTLDSRVGIDIEEFNSKVDIHGLAKRFFSTAEAAELANLPSEEQFEGFYRGWTCKEAYIKATGRGLSTSLSSFVVTIDPRKPAALNYVDNMPNEPGMWTVCSLDVAPKYAGAIMVSRPDCSIRCWQWRTD